MGRKKNEYKKSFRNWEKKRIAASRKGDWILLSCAVFLTVIIVMIFTVLFVNKATVLPSDVKNSLYKNIKKIDYQQKEEDGKGEPQPKDSPTIRFDHFQINDEPELNKKGIFRLIDYKNEILKTKITAPPSYDYKEVNNKLFWVDLAIIGKSYWALMSSDPRIKVKNETYFDEEGNSVMIPYFDIDNSLQNRGMNSSRESFGLLLNNNNQNVNTLSLNKKLIIPGKDTDFAIYTNFLEHFKTVVTIRGGILRQKNIEEAEIDKDNIIASTDNSFTIDVIFNGGKRALTYNSKMANSFKFKTRLKVQKEKDNDGGIAYSVTQLEIPKTEKNKQNVYTWNFPITVESISIFTKYNKLKGSPIPIKGIYNEPDTVLATYDKSTNSFLLPRYYSTDSKNAVVASGTRAFGNTPLENWKNGAVVKNIGGIKGSAYTQKSVENAKQIKMVLSVRGFFETFSAKLTSISNSWLEGNNGVGISLGSWTIYVRFDEQTDNTTDMVFFLTSVGDYHDIRLVSFQILL